MSTWQCGQGQVKHYQAANLAVQSLGCQSWCHGHDVRVLLLGQLYMGFAVIAHVLFNDIFVIVIHDIDMRDLIWLSAIECTPGTSIHYNKIAMHKITIISGYNMQYKDPSHKHDF